MPVEHYENFPVASWLLPSRLRPAVEAIYAFARTADDLADEGNATPAERLSALEAFDAALRAIEAGQAPSSALFTRLAQVIRDYRLPVQPFRDLLSAFKQDVVTKRYATYADLADYCRRSANPVGILMLRLYDAATPENLRDSDAICTALQLINFWQDVAIDLEKQRIYLPQEDMARYGVTEDQLATGRRDDAWRSLMRFEVERARHLMVSGAPLCLRLPGRIGWELRMVVQGGMRILERIEAVDYDVYDHRPRLALRDWLVIAARSAGMKFSLSRQRQLG